MHHGRAGKPDAGCVRFVELTDVPRSPCWMTGALGSCFHRNDELANRRSSERWNPARGDRLSRRGLLRKADATPSPCWRTGALGSCFHRNDELAIRRSCERWNLARGDRFSPRGFLRKSRCGALAVLANRGAGFLFSQERRAGDPSFQRTLEPSAGQSVFASRLPTQRPMRRSRHAGKPRRWVPVFTGTTIWQSVVPANAGTQRGAIGYRVAASYAKADVAPLPCWRTEALGSCFHRNDERGNHTLR
ncbi:MAG: hypothetical protein GAK28_02004 [Luteibacter sp.]|nr:MAG: hypothetical protein GAK28_02004 [Luteibacter sp.]